jgi:hypothetical protein
VEDFPTRIADFLESIAAKVRSLTVDRLERWTKWVAAGVVLSVLAFLIIVFLLIGLFRLLGAVTGFTIAYTIIGGIFLVVGVLLWSKRKPTT